MAAEPQSVLVVTSPNHPPRCYPFEGNQVQIGRGKNNHIRIDEQAISKTHCEFFRGPKFPQWKFRDLGSTNGSRLNGQQVEWDALSVDEGDEIVLGGAITLLLVTMHELEVPESLEEDDPNVNPVAAAVARHGREDMEGTQLIKLPRRKR